MTLTDPRPINMSAAPTGASSAGSDLPQANHPAASIAPAPAGSAPPAPARVTPQPKDEALGLADPLLALAAEVLDDLERVRIANENRLRQLTRDEADSDGEERGFGLTADHPDVARLAGLVEALAAAEHQATLNLQRQMRAHPLGAWVKATVGVGEKQAARLLAAIGDPYWHSRDDRPRTVSELWAYCGLHTLPARQGESDTHHLGAGGTDLPIGHVRHDPHRGNADGDQALARHAVADAHPTRAGETEFPIGHTTRDAHLARADGARLPADHVSTDAQVEHVGGNQTGGHPDRTRSDTHSFCARVAAKRQRGQKANWSTTAKTRVYLIAESCIKQRTSPYRAVYDAGREKYADAAHPEPCIRCGPSGKPAAKGSPLSLGHQHARAMRLVMKELLKDLWREAKRLHEGGA